MEICSDLACGGVTPERDLVQRSSAIARPNVLIRPRGGDFVYSRAELDAMLAQIAGLADADVGLVIGALQPDRTIDESATRRLLQGSSPARFTFHKAFDLVPNPTESLEVLIDLGFRRVLTSGGPVRAIDGIATLARLVEAARGRIEVVAGGAIRIEHLPPLVKDARLDALHLGSGVRPASQSRAIEPVAANLVRDVVEALRQ